MGQGPLEGLRVLELTGLGPAPMAAMLLADLGAEVLRLDRPGSATAAWEVTARGRRSVAVDLKHPRGLDTARALCARADVLIEGFRPGVMERLGLGPDAVWSRNPALVYGRMTGWGQEGPWAATAGHDVNYLAVTGVLAGIGRAGGPPQIPMNLLGDFGGGSLYLVVGILAALLEARSSGRGQVVDAAIVDGASSLAAMVWGLRAAGMWQGERGANLLDGGEPYYAVYECADGGWFSFGPLEPQFFAEAMRLLGLPESWTTERHDPSRREALRSAISKAFASRTRSDWAQIFSGSDACAAPVLTWAEAPSHPQVAARHTLVDVDGIVQPAPAPRLSRTPGAIAGPPPRPGQHTQAALTDWGVPDVEGLLAAGAVQQEAPATAP